MQRWATSVQLERWIASAQGNLLDKPIVIDSLALLDTPNLHQTGMGTITVSEFITLAEARRVQRWFVQPDVEVEIITPIRDAIVVGESVYVLLA